jgi:hypothetical protein
VVGWVGRGIDERAVGLIARPEALWQQRHAAQALQLTAGT